MQKIKKNLIVIYLFILGLSLGLLTNLTYAEQSGSSPNTGGVSSVINKGYDFLVSKGTNYGNSQPSDWTSNWGTMWNRIMYSALWEPDGTATEDDVLAGKTFYSGLNNRTIKTGTALAGFLPDYSLQQYVQYVDSHASDYQGEESTWINTNTTPSTEVWKDTRTGLYWARSEPATKTNSFTVASCDFYTTTPRGSYGASTTDPDCGAAINACAVLSLASTSGQSANTDWYLPSQKELLQAHFDGIYNQTSSSFIAAESLYWASTQYYQYDYANYLNLSTGYVYYNDKTVEIQVGCVRRD